jgi:hypothetical protein
MEHEHHWRATSKVFALVCECGIAYHEWLLTEIDQLKVASVSPPPQGPNEEVVALRAQLEEARREAGSLRAELDEARRELETRAEKVTGQIIGAVPAS